MCAVWAHHMLCMCVHAGEEGVQSVRYQIDRSQIKFGQHYYYKKSLLRGLENGQWQVATGWRGGQTEATEQLFLLHSSVTPG